MLTIVMLLLIPFFRYDEQTDSNEVITKLNYNNQTLYVVKESKDGKEFNVKTFDKPPIEKKNMIYYQSMDVRVILSGIFIFLFSVMIIIGTFSSDSDMSWNMSRCFSKACVNEVICEFEDENYCYVFEGRLLYREPYQIDGSTISDRLRKYFKNPNLFPPFDTKEGKREKKLAEILG
jgi:hypothetical protein